MLRIITSALVSLFTFSFIFIQNRNKSGGDMAIVVFNLMFGILQLVSILIIGKIMKLRNQNALLTVIIFQFIEILTMKYFGYEIRGWINNL